MTFWFPLLLLSRESISIWKISENTVLVVWLLAVGNLSWKLKLNCMNFIIYSNLGAISSMLKWTWPPLRHSAQLTLNSPLLIQLQSNNPQADAEGTMEAIRDMIAEGPLHSTRDDKPDSPRTYFLLFFHLQNQKSWRHKVNSRITAVDDLSVCMFNGGRACRWVFECADQCVCVCGVYEWPCCKTLLQCTVVLHTG